MRDHTSHQEKKQKNLFRTATSKGHYPYKKFKNRLAFYFKKRPSWSLFFGGFQGGFQKLLIFFAILPMTTLANKNTILKWPQERQRKYNAPHNTSPISYKKHKSFDLKKAHQLSNIEKISPPLRRATITAGSDTSSNIEKSTPPIVVDQKEMLFQADLAFLKAKTALWEGQTEKAFRHFKTALRFAPHSKSLLLNLAKLYEQEGLLAEAIRFYQILAQNEPKSIIFQEKLVQIYKKQGLLRQALQYNESLLAQKPVRFAPLLSQAELLLRKQDLKRFLNTFKQLENQANEPYEKIQLFILKTYAGDVFPSLSQRRQNEVLKSADLKKPFYTEDFILKMVDFYETFGQPQAAQALLERFQATHKGLFSHKVAKALFNYYTHSGDHKKALENTKQLLQLGKMEDIHYFYMASHWISLEQYDKAILFLKDLHQKHPQRGNYLYMTGYALEKTGQLLQALRWFQQIPEYSGYFLSGGLKQAQILKNLGRMRESKALLKNLSFPSQGEVVVEALLPYAEVLMSGGHKSQALSALNKGLKIKPQNQDLLFAKGFYLDRMTKISPTKPSVLAQE